jgi:23S rRNA pseudouridine2457 synthase
VRKMTSAVGFPTLRLVRIRVGNIYLNDLKPGEVLEVDSFEV